jgi:hypothetical protein
MQTAWVLTAVGLVVFAAGMVLPAETTETVRVCLDGGDYCDNGDAMVVERSTENERKEPALVSGAVVALVGIVLLVSEEVERKSENPQEGFDNDNEDAEDWEGTYAEKPYKRVSDNEDAEDWEGTYAEKPYKRIGDE